MRKTDFNIDHLEFYRNTDNGRERYTAEHDCNELVMYDITILK